jgi:hypothetical protein
MRRTGMFAVAALLATTGFAGRAGAEDLAWKKLEKLGLQVEVPASSEFLDTSADAPGGQYSTPDGSCSVRVNQTTRAFTDGFDKAKEEVEKDPGLEISLEVVRAVPVEGGLFPSTPSYLFDPALGVLGSASFALHKQFRLGVQLGFHSHPGLSEDPHGGTYNYRLQSVPVQGILQVRRRLARGFGLQAELGAGMTIRILDLDSMTYQPDGGIVEDHERSTTVHPSYALGAGFWLGLSSSVELIGSARFEKARFGGCDPYDNCQYDNPDFVLFGFGLRWSSP